MREIEKVIKIIMYRGNCPNCGEEQEDDNKSNVDILCIKCNNINEKKFFENKKEQLIGAKIIDVDGYVEKAAYEDDIFFTFNSITIETKEGKKIIIEGDSDWCDSGYLELTERGSIND